MKVSISEPKLKEEQKPQEEVSSKESSACVKLVHFMILIAVLSVMIFAVLKFWHMHGTDEKVSGVERKLKMVEVEFKTLTDELRKTEQLISDIVDDVSRIVDKINRSAAQRQVTLQLQPEPLNMPSIFKKFKESMFAQKKHPILSIFEIELLQRYQKKGSIHQEQEPREEKNKTMEMDKSLIFPRRIRRAANSNGTQQNDEFWYHYAGDSSTSCKVPKQGLRTAEIRCKIWPQSISCHIYCVYGNAFPEGIVRTLNCSFAENRWSDYFEDCQPFVNCKVHLIGPGTLKCTENQVNVRPSCSIGCEEYEDHDATQPRTYECKADGTWNPPLPPCADKKSGVDLIRAPHILEHKSIDYPRR